MSARKGTKPPPIPTLPTIPDRPALQRPSQDLEEQKTTVFDSGNFRKEQSTPIKSVSMKTPAAAAPKQPTPEIKRPKLRAISEVSPLKHAQPQSLGYLAPPRDPDEVRKRRVRDYVIWGCVAVILASMIALGVWFLGR